MVKFKSIVLIVTGALFSGTVFSQSYAEKMAATVQRIWGDTINLRPGNTIHWTYDRGVVTKGLEYLWYNTGNAKYFRLIKTSMDAFVNADGTINGYKLDEYNIDHVLTGRSLLMLYRVTGEAKYRKAAELLRSQLLTHPRTHEGGFWHKKRYEWQMWLDGLYMGQPFYAEYAQTFHEDTAFNDITNQFVWMENHALDKKTGLLYHGWDESKTQKWANKTTGQSPHFWARAMGWYGMALVDALEYFPANHPGRQKLIDILNRTASAVVKVQDKQTGLWWDIMNMPHYKNNYEEASASCMLVYMLAKGVRFGWLPQSYVPAAKTGYAGILKKFISTDAAGNINLEGTVSVSGLGGDPGKYRDGSFEYYMSEKVVQNDPKGVGSFLKCATEMEILPLLSMGKGKTVLLDHYFNSETQKDATGATVPFHYIWEEKDNNGFSLLGHVFNTYGVATKTLYTQPTATDLKNASMYIIVDPDNLKDNPSPNYMNEEAASTIYQWVANGGVLLLMANDSVNCDLEHFNILAKKFGISFSNTSMNMVKGNDYPTGAIQLSKNNAVFGNTGQVYLKEICALDIKAPATAVASKDGKTVIASAKLGKGAVLAVGDPWLYNEYTDGRKLPAEYKNFEAAKQLVQWMIKQKK